MNVDYGEIGLRVAKRRKLLNLTQEELAEMAELSTTALQVTPDYLLSGTYKYIDEPKLDMIKTNILRCNAKHFDLILNFIVWVADQDVK